MWRLPGGFTSDETQYLTELQVPVKFIGVGEGMEDLQPFDAEAYVRELV